MQEMQCPGRVPQDRLAQCHLAAVVAKCVVSGIKLRADRLREAELLRQRWDASTIRILLKRYHQAAKLVWYQCCVCG